ncbi:sulfotransferase family protein [Cerasicoccus maritimus]|uniref:sulfotransferase family protein n=1 Tax=Cerasicoccus maritimus TaxID=490089 RepID=UPI00285289CA|nr:sulfotransferase [Cerasicoccus maritimus]
MTSEPAPSPTPAYRFTQELFIGGSPKSGTTLLLALLDNHPELVVFPVEIALFNETLSRLKDPTLAAITDYTLAHSEVTYMARSARPGADATPEQRVDFSQFDFAAFERALKQYRYPGDNACQQLLRNLGLAYAETRQPPVAPGDYTLVEKTPANDYNSDKLFEHFPEAKLLHIVRDPRAVFASRRRRFIKGGGKYSKAFRLLNEWNRSAWQVTRYQDQPERFLSIRYEDLVSDASAVMRRVADFLGIAYTDTLERPSRNGDSWEGNSSYDSRFGGISSDQLDRWRGELSLGEIWWVEQHCGKLMRACGYDLDNPEAPDALHLGRWLKPLPGESFSGYLRARRGSLGARFNPEKYWRPDR